MLGRTNPGPPGVFRCLIETNKFRFASSVYLLCMSKEGRNLTLNRVVHAIPVSLSLCYVGYYL